MSLANVSNSALAKNGLASKMTPRGKALPHLCDSSRLCRPGKRFCERMRAIISHAAFTVLVTSANVALLGRSFKWKPLDTKIQASLIKATEKQSPCLYFKEDKKFTKLFASSWGNFLTRRKRTLGVFLGTHEKRDCWGCQSHSGKRAIRSKPASGGRLSSLGAWTIFFGKSIR